MRPALEIASFPSCRSAEGCSDSPRFSAAAVVLRQTATMPRSLSSPTLTPAVSFFAAHSLLFGALTHSPQHFLLLLPPRAQSSSWMLRWRMLRCSAWPLVLLTTVIKWGEHRGDCAPAHSTPPPQPPSPLPPSHRTPHNAANGSTKLS